MSDHFLRFIPKDPAFVLDQADEVSVEATESVQFVDAGSNFESLSCPLCTADLDIEWWTESMERAFVGKLPELGVETPCCNRRTSLNDLDYVWPQGFARFLLQATNANVSDLPDGLLADLERILSCELRVIRAHY